MNLCGLDIATVTGVALMEDRKITTQTFRAAGKKRFLENENDKQLDAARMGAAGRSLEDFLMAYLIEHQVGYVAIEAPLNTNFMGPRRKLIAVDANAKWAGQAAQFEETKSGASLATFFKVHGLEFVACLVCSRLNIPAVFVNQSTWRKDFLGNGRPADPKKDARKMCAAMGIECTSDDAAESAGIVNWLDHTLNPYGIRAANDLFKAG